MIRVALLIATLDKAGAEKQVAFVASALDRRRFEPTVLCLRRGGPYEEPLRRAGVPVRVLGQRRKLSWTLHRRLTAALREIRPHVLHTWLFTSHFYGRLAGILARVPVLVIGERCVDLWKTPLHWAIDRALACRTDAIVANARATLDFLATRGVAAPVMRVIPNALDPALTRDPQPPAAAPRWDFLAVGRLHPQKDYPALIAALSAVRAAHPKATLAIAGEGPERARLEALAAREGFSAAVTFLGPRTDVPALMAQARCFVMSSRYEGSPNSLLEALAVGTPVVTTAAGGAAELVPPEAGIIVPVGDVARLAAGMRWTLEHQAAARERAARAAAVVRERHALDKAVAAHESLYEELLRGKGLL